MKTIRWGMIGCGSVTQVKSGPGFQKADHSALVAVMGRSAEKARAYASQHNVPRWYDDAAKLVNDPEVDAVYIATPPSSHEEYTFLAARAGKAVYVEKPMARTHQECLRMIEACRAARVRLFVAYYRRALPRFLKVKELVDQGAIGTPRFAQVTLYQPPEANDADPARQPWRVIPEIAGGGRFLDLASHTLDILDFILGPIAQVHGSASNQMGIYEAEDIVAGHWTFESGAYGTGVWCFGAQRRADENLIVGSQGQIRFSTFETEPIRLEDATGVHEFPLTNPVHVQQPLIQTMVDDLNGIGTCPSTGDSGARTNWVMDQMLQSWRERAKASQIR